MPKTPKRATKAELADQVATLERRNRSLEVLLERAEQDRDRALGRLSTCASENTVLRSVMHRLQTSTGGEVPS